MSTKNKTSPSLILDGFRGVDHRFTHTDGQVAADLINFRIRDDRSLEKRPGFRFLADLGSPIRAFYKVISGGEECAYILAGNTVYSVNLVTGDKTVLGTVETDSGSGCFFFCNNVPYLSDGLDLYLYNGTEFLPAEGYVPLIGKDWENDFVGEPYEPMNILTRRVRISYRVSTETPSIFMCAGRPIESVQAVYRNGIAVDPEQYYIDELFQSVNVKGTRPGDQLEIYLTFVSACEELRQLFLSAKNAILFGGTNNHRLFFWGCDDPSVMFCSAYVSNEQLAASSLHNDSANDLYIPAGYEFRMGAMGHPIQGCACHYDRLLIFTECDAWMASADASGLEEFSLTVINTELGCASRDGVAAVGNYPVTLGRHSVYQWRQESDVPDRCNADRISQEIDGILSPEEYVQSGLYYAPYQNELWFYNRNSGTVWVRNLSGGNWYRFTGIHADQFFDAGGAVGFYRGSGLYVFDDSLDSDRVSETDLRPISASYVGSLADFGTETYKNLAAVTLWGDGSGALSMAFEREGGKEAEVLLLEQEAPAHRIRRKRISSGRFRYGRIKLSAPPGGRQVIHRLSLHTR